LKEKMSINFEKKQASSANVRIRAISKSRPAGHRLPVAGIFVEKVGQNATGTDVYSVKTLIVGQVLINFDQIAGREAVVNRAIELHKSSLGKYKVYEVVA
jgi:hypothetical protein